MYDLALALSVLCLMSVLVAFVRTPTFSLFHPLTFYISFHGFIFVFRPIVARIMDFDAIYQGYRFTPTIDDKITVILASNLGFLIFTAACWYTGRVPMVFKQDQFAKCERDSLRSSFIITAAVCVPVGLYSLATSFNSASSNGSSVQGMIQDAATGIATNTQVIGYFTEAQLMLASFSVIIAWLFRFRLLAMMPLLGFVIFRAGTGGRGPFVTAMVSLGLLYLYEQRRRIPSLQIGALLVGVALVFSTVGNDRGLAIRKLIGNDTASDVFTSTRSNERFLEGMDFANMEYFEYLVYAIPERTKTYGYFLDNLQIFTEPVPRVLWKDKPIGAPFNRIYLLDYGTPFGMTRSLPGQGWYSLGWLGVVIWCGLWGYVLGLIYRRFVEGPQSAFKTAAYMIFVPILIVAFRDGQLVTVFRQGLFYIGPVILWFYTARFAGVPSAVMMRTAAARSLQRRGGSDTQVALQPSEQDRALAALPPAVQRRRAALEADKPQQA